MSLVAFIILSFNICLVIRSIISTSLVIRQRMSSRLIRLERIRENKPVKNSSSRKVNKQNATNEKDAHVKYIRKNLIPTAEKRNVAKSFEIILSPNLFRNSAGVLSSLFPSPLSSFFFLSSHTVTLLFWLSDRNCTHGVFVGYFCSHAKSFFTTSDYSKNFKLPDVFYLL